MLITLTPEAAIRLFTVLPKFTGNTGQPAVLGQVRLTVTTDAVTGVATNRYLAGVQRETLAHAPAETGEFAADVDQAKVYVAQARAAKKTRQKTVDLELSPAAGDYPNLGKLIRGLCCGDLKPGSPDLVNPELLAPFIAAAKANKSTSLRFWQTATQKQLITELGDSFLGLLMPMRDDSELLAPTARLVPDLPA